MIVVLPAPKTPKMPRPKNAKLHRVEIHLHGQRKDRNQLVQILALWAPRQGYDMLVSDIDQPEAVYLETNP